MQVIEGGVRVIEGAVQVIERAVRVIEALLHKMRGSGFRFLVGSWKFSSELFLLSAISSLGIQLASNRNE